MTIVAGIEVARYPVGMSHFYINSYAPLVASEAGRKASIAHDILPFVDGSIRREPDLEHKHPSISCLCRIDKFAPRLEVGDVVAYMTKKARYGTPVRHRRLTAVLIVLHTFDSHGAAAKWYEQRRLLPPRNCMIRGNSALPLDHSHRLSGDAKTKREWNAEYRRRARKYPKFVVCGVIFRDLSWNAPVVEDRVLLRALGEIPATLNPGRRQLREYRDLMIALGIAVPPSAP